MSSRGVCDHYQCRDRSRDQSSYHGEEGSRDHYQRRDRSRDQSSYHGEEGSRDHYQCRDRSRDRDDEDIVDSRPGDFNWPGYHYDDYYDDYMN